jgi:hypothetical protein
MVGGDDRGAPLVGGEGRREGGEALVAPLDEEVLLVLAGDDRVGGAEVLERLDGGDGGGAGVHPDGVDGAEALEVVLDDRLGVGGRPR